MAQQKFVIRTVEGIILTDAKTYILSRLLTVRHRFTVSHKGLPFEIGFDKLNDAEAFFNAEVQARRRSTAIKNGFGDIRCPKKH
jgi:hypothetical protein